MNLKIYIATHKKFDVPKSKYHIPLHVGREGKEDLGYLGDNTGDNISLENANYCELTGFYWIWKNVKDADYVGLCHYRRYFIVATKLNDFYYYTSLSLRKIKGFLKNRKEWKERKTTIKGYSYLNKNIMKTEKYLENKLNDSDVLLLKEFKLNISMKTHAETLFKREVEILRRIIEKNHLDYLKAYDDFMEGNKISPCNMVICKKEIFDKYSKWLFSIFHQLEKEVEISEDTYKARIFGFLSEYLLNIYFQYNKNYRINRMDMLFIK
jgi:hypothetical protein